MSESRDGTYEDAIRRLTLEVAWKNEEIERLQAEVQYERERNEANVAASQREIERLEEIIYGGPESDAYLAEVLRIDKKREGR